MRALSIRQHYAELIPGGRGIKKIEYRSRATKIIGERFYIYAYAAKTPGEIEALAGLECEAVVGS